MSKYSWGGSQNRTNDTKQTTLEDDQHHASHLVHVTNESECKISGMPKFTRLIDLQSNDRLEPYHRRATEFKPQLHWGQLKLFLTEVEFLNIVRSLVKPLQEKSNKNGHNSYKIILIYPGAAPGNHTNFLHSMFPEMEFHLYDKQKFVAKPTKQIMLYDQYFFEEDAKKWKATIDKLKGSGENVFVALCSDIRTEPATEDEVKKNMEMQRQWWDIIEPDLTMFKFRLPWSPGITVYPLGEIYIQPFAGQTSTETRLIFKKNAPLIEYDNQKYEQALFFHNTKARNCLWPTQFEKMPTLENDGFCTCYDCSALVWILSDYLKIPHDKKFNIEQETAIKLLIKKMEAHMSGTNKSIILQTKNSHKKVQHYANNYKKNPELLNISGDDILKKRVSKSRIKAQKD
jgi:hypothetical protein